MRLILGSASKCRGDILRFFTLPFQQIPSKFPEETVAFRGDPVEYSSELSQKKAEALSAKFPEETILTADTVVFINGKILNKPIDLQEAVSFLTELAGVWHNVITSVTIRKGPDYFTEAENTRVLFHPLTEKQIVSYLSYFAYTDKAGGFSVEGSGNVIVKRIEGCYYNVLGLPMNPLRSLLLKMGIDLWDYLKS